MPELTRTRAKASRRTWKGLRGLKNWEMLLITSSRDDSHRGSVRTLPCKTEEISSVFKPLPHPRIRRFSFSLTTHLDLRRFYICILLIYNCTDVLILLAHLRDTIDKAHAGQDKNVGTHGKMGCTLVRSGTCCNLCSECINTFNSSETEMLCTDMLSTSLQS